MILPYIEDTSIKIGVVGVGGGGGNILNSLIGSNLQKVKYYAVNTDRQALAFSLAPNKIQIGAQITHGLGAGGNPEIGKKAVEEDALRIKEIVKGIDLLFLLACFGGGTGTGATPKICEIAKEEGSLVVSLVSKPFYHEGKISFQIAKEGIERLKEISDTIIIIPNDKVREAYGQMTPAEAFKKANELVVGVVGGVVNLISEPQLIAIDFADIKDVVTGKGRAVIGIGEARGEKRVQEAVKKALSSPFLAGADIKTAKKMLLWVSGDESLTLEEVSLACEMIKSSTNGQTKIRFSINQDKRLKDTIIVTFLTTGLVEEAVDEYEIEEILNRFKGNNGKEEGNGLFSEPNGPGQEIDKNNYEIPAILRFRDEFKIL